MSSHFEYSEGQLAKGNLRTALAHELKPLLVPKMSVYTKSLGLLCARSASLPVSKTLLYGLPFSSQHPRTLTGHLGLANDHSILETRSSISWDGLLSNWS